MYIDFNAFFFYMLLFFSSSVIQDSFCPILFVFGFFVLIKSGLFPKAEIASLSVLFVLFL